MNFVIHPDIHMWFMLAVTAIAVFAFVREKIPLEITSIALMTVLLVYGQIFYIADPASPEGGLNPQTVLSGFANPSLIAVLALLVMGQGMIHTESLRFVTNFLVFRNQKFAWLSLVSLLVFVCVMSGLMNNTPLVIIAIPLLQVLAKSVGMASNRIMMPLSFVAILGGMTTLVGSSTNLLVSSTMVELGYEPLGFFDFFVPGAILAVVGFVYVLFVVPYMLPKRKTITEELVGDEKEFVAELDIAEDSKLVGVECVEGVFPGLEDMNVKLIQRAGHLILPPFEGYKINKGDILIVATTRQTLGNWLSKYPGFLLSEEEAEVIEGGKEEKSGDDENKSPIEGTETRVLAQIMITPASRMIDMSMEHVNFHKQFGAIILGIQRRARVVRRRLGRIRLEAGDVLLIAGKNSVVNNLRNNPDFIVLSGSKRDLPVPGKAPIAIGVFLLTIGSAASGFVSIPAAAFAGAAAMIASGCLNIRQATRAIDRKIFLLVGSMLALGNALQVTGGAGYISSLIMGASFANTPLAMVALLFIIVAFTTNIMTNNACAILFTPIALSLAESIPQPPDLEYSLSFIFAVTVVFAANCSFASPIGYQTNLLVMGPGQYRFRDFIKAGVPLVLLLWCTYIIVAWSYFGL